MSGPGFTSQVEPAYFHVRTEPRPYRPQGDLLFGVLALGLTTRTPVHVGTGAPRIVPLEGGGDVVVSGMTETPTGSRAGKDGEGPAEPRAVVPGSSVKGAVRAVFEALTSSCAVTTSSCGGKKGAKDGLCAACQTFGAQGLRGRVGFDEVVFPVPPVEVVRFPQRYGGRARDTKLRRFYKPKPERSEASDMEAVLCVEAGVEARLRVRIAGIDRPSAGALVAALGLVEGTMPYLRLGGGKNRGLGIVDVRFKEGWVGSDATAPVLGKTKPLASEDLASWVQEARQVFTPGFDEVLADLRQGYEEGL
ncbi:MAG: hypothetical protein KatS3mg008_1303 [Acidimicrobiales bacterium]|nr:MAG: hypothetical protein KatS3mg008_1303 [Acidimicrobiales bacterium]